MYSVELYGRVRRAVFVEGKSQRAVAREFGIARESVRKMLRYSAPPGFRGDPPANEFFDDTDCQLKQHGFSISSGC